MQKINFIENGVLRLPPGFRFHPTDEELLVQYLQRKVVSAPLPACIIPEVDACKSDPWDLPGDLENERYFFSTKEAKYPNGNRTNRATCSGYWKATGADKQISSSKNRNQVVGMKKTLVFYRGKPPHGARTDWIMHEYRLVNVAASDLQGCVSEMENWVLCRIFLKKRSNKIEEEATAAASQSCIDDGKNQVRKISRKPLLYDLNVAPLCMSSSGQSEITEISNYEFEDNEENSSCNSFLMSVCRKP